MYNGKSNRKFGRETKPRRMLIRSLAVALVLNQKIKTTEAKAKSLKVFIEKLISKSRKITLAGSRLLMAELGRKAAQKLTKEIAPKLAERKGGYTRIIKLPPRISDGANMAIIEIIT